MRGHYFRLMMVGVVAALAAAQQAVGQDIEAVSGIEAVTLYRDQALVMRSVKAGVPAGASELVVGDLPSQILGDSLFASADDGTLIRAVRYRERAVQEEPREEIRQLDQQIEKQQDELRRTDVMRGLAEERKQYLDKLEQFTAPTAQVELSKGVLNAETLKSLTLFTFEQRKGLAEEVLQLELTQRELNKEIALLQRKRAELTKSVARTVREAVVFVDRPQAGKADLRLSYLVRQAGWEPAYNLRAGADGGGVTVEYNATAYQMSGEDWDKVELMLSTASPEFQASGPELAPFLVTLSSGPTGAPPGEVAERLERSRDELAKQLRAAQRAAGDEERIEGVWSSNVAAFAMQSEEIAAPQSALRLTKPVPTEGLSVTYALPGRISLKSRSDRQMVQIASTDLEGAFHYVATPMLTSYVYREAEVLNEGDVALLEGRGTCYLDGRFVGQSRLPLVARGQKFRTGFGMNSQLRAARELVEKTERTLGGNCQQSFHYRLTLENYSDEPVSVRLYDRMPKPMEGAEIRVTLGEMSDKLSEDPFYLEKEYPHGILRWDVEVPAKSAGPQARKVEYSYTLEFDRELVVVTPAGIGKEGKAREEFQRLMEERHKGY